MVNYKELKNAKLYVKTNNYESNGEIKESKSLVLVHTYYNEVLQKEMTEEINLTGKNSNLICYNKLSNNELD